MKTKISGASGKTTTKKVPKAPPAKPLRLSATGKNNKVLSQRRRWKIHILNKQRQFHLNLLRIKAAAKTILALMENSPLPPCVCELSLLFTNNAEIQNLNCLYRGKDKATDVLSFSQLEGAHGAISPMLGDIVISVEYAAAQARIHSVSLNKEILRLLVHGILHLFGFNHENVNKATQQQMKRKEKAMFSAIELDF